jgi:hypothetical protein
LKKEDGRWEEEKCTVAYEGERRIVKGTKRLPTI